MKKIFYFTSAIFIVLSFHFNSLAQAISEEVFAQIEEQTPFESISLCKDSTGLVSIYWGKSNVSLRHLEFNIKIWETGTLQPADTCRLEYTVYQLDAFPFIPIKPRKKFQLKPGKEYMFEVSFLVTRYLPQNNISIEWKKIQKTITA